MEGASPVIAALSKQLLDRVDEIAASLAVQTMAQVVAYREAVPMDDLRETTTANLVALLNRMSGVAPDDFGAPAMTPRRPERPVARGAAFLPPRRAPHLA